jgi:hypothetical protein
MRKYGTSFEKTLAAFKRYIWGQLENHKVGNIIM